MLFMREFWAGLALNLYFYLSKGDQERMPVVEEQIKVINHRIEDLEDANKA